MTSLAKPSSVHQQLRPRKTRTKTGCLTCRSRRKKCDERRPTCFNCTRWQGHCTWPTFLLIEAPSSSTRDPFQKQKTRKAKQSPFPSRCHHDTTIPTPLSEGGPIPDNEDNVSILSPSAISSLDSPDQTISLQLFEFFILEGCKGMTGRLPSEDPLVRLLLQLSQSDKLIRSGVLALSGSRLSPISSVVAVQKATLYHYNETLVELQAALAHWPPTSGEEVIRILTILILLCSHEVSSNAQSCLCA